MSSTGRALGIIFVTLALAPSPGSADEAWPGDEWVRARPAEVGLDAARLAEARDYALTGEGSGFITRHGKLVMSWGDVARRYDLKSTTKSFGATALGVALLDGKLKLADPAHRYHPQFGLPPESNRQTGWLDRITILHLATQTAGFEKPGGYEKLVFEPGTKWGYSDGGPNWLAECLTRIYREDLNTLMFERVFSPLGISNKDLTWRNHSYRPREIDGIARREFGSGISANVDAMARVGLLYLRRGEWKGKRILPADFVQQASSPHPDVVGLPVVKPDEYGRASDHYGLLWWNNADGTLPDVPRDAFWSWGLYDSLIVVIPSLDLVVARAGRSWKRTPGADPYDVLAPFLNPIVAAAGFKAPRGDNASGPRALPASRPVAFHAPASAPYPASPVIKNVRWAPADSIRRQAKGSDNWPVTWVDDDQLYTAYGDGKGFREPRVERKLSMGLARVTGGPDDFQGTNLRAPSLEALGDGARGKKASGILMVDGTLYLWARNAENAQLAWSTDRGRTWTWSDWKLTESFGYPTFLNFGRNYAGARDAFVYIYSHDHDSAYRAADRMVLARVPVDRIRDRAAYEFFAGLDAAQQPTWSTDIRKRASVFSHPGRCYRSGITYSESLKRYLWCQVLPGDDTRFQGGFGIYDAPEPWGPWTTVYFTDEWDVGPGETCSLPTKWMSPDGRTLHLVFSGDDCFSVRKATLDLHD